MPYKLALDYSIAYIIYRISHNLIVNREKLAKIIFFLKRNARYSFPKFGILSASESLESGIPPRNKKLKIN